MKQTINHIKFILSVFILFTTINTAFAQTTDFSGTYKLNETKTDFGQAPHTVLPIKFAVTQGKDQITFNRTTVNANKEEITGTEILKFDGSIAERSLPDNGKRTASLKWADNHQTFTINSTSVNADQSQTTKINETWSLEDGGKTLVANREVEQSNGFKYTIKGYYDKQ